MRGCRPWRQQTAYAILAQAAGQPDGVPAAFHRRGGIHHLTAAGATNWFGFANAALAQAVDPARPLKQLRPIPSSLYPTRAVRPANSRLDCSRLEHRWKMVLPTWEHALAHCLKELDPSTLV